MYELVKILSHRMLAVKKKKCLLQTVLVEIILISVQRLLQLRVGDTVSQRRISLRCYQSVYLRASRALLGDRYSTRTPATHQSASARVFCFFFQSASHTHTNTPVRLGCECVGAMVMLPVWLEIIARFAL